MRGVNAWARSLNETFRAAGILQFIDLAKFILLTDRIVTSHALRAAQGTTQHERLDCEVAQVCPGRLLFVGVTKCANEKAFEAIPRLRLGERLHARTNIDPSVMPRSFDRADRFARCALRELFAIVQVGVLAVRSTLLGHGFSVTWWITIESGKSPDLEAPGSLAAGVAGLAASPAERMVFGARVLAMAGVEIIPRASLTDCRQFHTDTQAGARRSA